MFDNNRARISELSEENRESGCVRVVETATVTPGEEVRSIKIYSTKGQKSDSIK